MNKEKTVILISCVARKQQYPAPASDLYNSPWFNLAKAYAEQSGHPWFILSAEYGFLSIHKTIEPYDTTLKQMTHANRKKWASKVLTAIKTKIEPDYKIIILAGLPYREFLTDLLTQAGYTVQIPMANLGIGQQLAWLKNELGQVEPQPPAEPPASIPKVFPEYPTTDQGLSLVPLDLIDQNPYQPRLDLNPVETQQLARSIRIQRKTLPDTKGLLQTPVARPGSDGRIQLAFGHRRLAAFKYNDKFHGDEWGTWAAMPIKLVQMNDEEMYKTATIENDQRVNLNAIERATSLQKGIDTFKWTFEQAGKVHGLKKGSVKNLTDLLKLPPSVRESVAKGELAQKSGRYLVRLMKEDPPLTKKCIELARHIVFNQISTSTVEILVKQALKENDELKQLKAEVAALPCLRCNKKTLFTTGPFRISPITCEACNAKYHGVGDYEDCKAEIERAESRKNHREYRYCRNCSKRRTFTGQEIFVEKSITCHHCNANNKPFRWLTEYRPQPEFDCPHCSSLQSIAINEYDKGEPFLKCFVCNVEWPNVEILNQAIFMKYSKKSYCPTCDKMNIIDIRHATPKCKHCNTESQRKNWFESLPVIYYCPECSNSRKFESNQSTFGCSHCGHISNKKNWLQQPEPQPDPQPPTPNPLRCHLCNGTIQRRDGGGLKCSDCQMQWSNLRRFREDKAAFNKENETITDQITNDAEAKKLTIQEIWDTNNKELACEIVPTPWLPEPCLECGQIPLELEPAQEAFLEQILNISDHNLAILDRIITIMKHATLQDLEKLQKLTTNGDKFLQAINK